MHGYCRGSVYCLIDLFISVWKESVLMAGCLGVQCSAVLSCREKLEQVVRGLHCSILHSGIHGKSTKNRNVKSQTNLF